MTAKGVCETMTDAELFELVRKNYSQSNKEYLIDQVQKACVHCPNNPQTGGSGICHCILGSPVVYLSGGSKKANWNCTEKGEENEQKQA